MLIPYQYIKMFSPSNLSHSCIIYMLTAFRKFFTMAEVKQDMKKMFFQRINRFFIAGEMTDVEFIFNNGAENETVCLLSI